MTPYEIRVKTRILRTTGSLDRECQDGRIDRWGWLCLVIIGVCIVLFKRHRYLLVAQG